MKLHNKLNLIVVPLVIVALLGVSFWTRPVGMQSVELLPKALTLEVDKASIPVKLATEVTFRGMSEEGNSDEKLDLRSTELGIKTQVTLKELRAGVTRELLAKKPGVFEVVAMQGPVKRGSAIIAAHVDSTLAGSPNVRYELVQADAVRAAESGSLLIDLFVTRSAKESLVSLPSNLKVRIFERVKDTSQKGIDETVLFVGARTRNVVVPLEVSTNKSFQAEVLEEGKPAEKLNSLQVSWAKDGPKLKIQAQPIRASAYATAKTPCMVALQLEYQGVRVIPGEFGINPRLPEFLSIQPSPPLAISGDGYIVCEAASTRARDAEITFTGPSAVPASVTLHYESVLWFYIVATVAGMLVGLLFLLFRSREEPDFIEFVKLNLWRIFWHGLMSAFAGLFVSFCLVYGFFVQVTLSELLLTVPGGIIVGTIGGLIGENIVHFIFPYVPGPGGGD